jgi:hypothetical protein
MKNVFTAVCAELYAITIPCMKRNIKLTEVNVTPAVNAPTLAHIPRLK